MATEEILRKTLHNADRKPFAKYRNIQGSFVTEGFELFVDEVQGDRTGHTRMRVRVPMKRARFPEDTYGTESRRTALGDIIARRFWESARTHAKSPFPKMDGGVVYMPRPGQEIIPRGSVRVTEFYVEASFTADLPAKGNCVDEMAAIDLIFGRISLIVSESMLYSAYKEQKLYQHIETAENADSIRSRLPEMGLASFVAVGSVLPRREDDLAPMIGAVPFDCDDSLKVTMEVPNGEPIVGMGIRRGFTAITGPSASGKSTLADAVFSGIYDHIPGDGREYVVSDPDAVYVMTEAGRPVDGSRVSGPVSEIASVDEAVECGSHLVILDEEYSCPNVIRRSFVSGADDLVPISEVAHSMGEKGVSVLMVTGDTPAVCRADNVIVMENLFAKRMEMQPTSGREYGMPADRHPVSNKVSFEKGRKDVSTSAPDIRTVEIGEYKVHVPVAGFFDPAQTREAADVIAAARELMDGSRTLVQACSEAIAKVEADDAENGTGMAHARTRVVDVAAVLSRHPQMIFIRKNRGRSRGLPPPVKDSAEIVPVLVLPVVEHAVRVVVDVDLVDLAVRHDEARDGVLLVAERAADVRAVGTGLRAVLAGHCAGLEEAELPPAVGTKVAPGGDLQVLRDSGGPLLRREPHGRARGDRRVVGRSLAPIRHISLSLRCCHDALQNGAVLALLQ